MKNFMIAAGAALVTAVITASCGGSGDLCQDNQVRCEAPLACDPEDGICKCGGRGGKICDEGFSCDENSNTCLSTRCVGVNCQGGTSCDVLTGTCKCGGTGGQVCGENQVCNPSTQACESAVDCTQINCPVQQSCNAQTGVCECGGAACASGQSCTVAMDETRQCVQDNCFGVSCLGGTTCDPADGRCKCNGAACSAGSVCGCPLDAGSCTQAQRSCQPGSACANVTCPGASSCDPLDGQCKCGGPGGPVCGQDQVCDITTNTCQGGNQCEFADGGVKACDPGLSCDPEDGKCKCGGRGGTVCGDGTDGGVEETCVQSLFAQTCRPRCDPRFQDCPSGTYCYYDTLAKTPTAYCAVPSDARLQGQGCNNPTACFTEDPTPKGLFCQGLGNFDMPGGTGFCRAFCDTTTGDQSCVQFPDPQTCNPIPGAPPGVGFCQPV